MRFFLAGLGNWAGDLGSIREAVMEADRVGFDGILMPDHYMWGDVEWLGRPDRNVTLDTWVTLTYLAAITDEIRLGTLVTPIPFRPPGMLAKMTSTLDILSKGRVVVGVGAGWSQVEFEGYSSWDEPKVRVDKTREGIELMIELWTHDEVTFEGKYYQAKAAVLEPKPVQKPYPPLLFGGSGDRMLKLAGKYADICYIPLFRDSDRYEEGRAKVLKAAAKANRTDKIAFMAGALSSWDPYDTKVHFRKVEGASEMGASYFLTSFPRTRELTNSIRRFSQEVIPSFR